VLFNSYSFILLFLPASLLAFTLANRIFGARAGVAVVVLASLLFYAAWDPRFLALLLPSILANHALGHALAALREAGRTRALRRLLAAGVAANLLPLAIFKYAGFLAGALNGALATSVPVLAFALPLGISFFTFEQIGYLVDVARAMPPARSLLRYAMFVAFFPRLVAGPILRYSEILPQVPATAPIAQTTADVAVGLTLFCAGLAKKTFFADGIAPFASSLFASAAHGPPDLLAAWGGVLAYTLQIYFDFSGYSDMATGIARMFGIRFPQNFNSPYQATSIIAFWRRWHMSLSRFLRDYLYIALGGNRRGPARRHLNLAATMLLGGLWHGANWTFVAWGGLHGLYLVINHLWRQLRLAHPSLDAAARTRPARLAAWALTFAAVMLAWVFFRAPSFAVALTVLHAMAGLDGCTIPLAIADAAPALAHLAAALHIPTNPGSGSNFVRLWAWNLALLPVAALMPSTTHLLRARTPTLEPAEGQPPCFASLLWQPTGRWALAIAASGALGFLTLTHGGEFLYWQF
jgi:D-alanyl-lipoteichoic acid acyltransferase DltB (MBOAT superfamily)